MVSKYDDDDDDDDKQFFRPISIVFDLVVITCSV